MKQRFMETVFFCIISYLIGSISFALIIGKLFYKTDLRKEGSGNLGATNTFRILGKKAGFIVCLGDILKGTLPTLFPLLIGIEAHPILLGLFAIIGHVFPVYSKFKGGKAVATTSGVILAYEPMLFVVLVATFFVVLYLTKIVSISSILGTVVLFIGSFFMDDYTFTIFSAFTCIFITFKHKENLKRIKNKEEPKIKWM